MPEGLTAAEEISKFEQIASHPVSGCYVIVLQMAFTAAIHCWKLFPLPVVLEGQYISFPVSGVFLSLGEEKPAPSDLNSVLQSAS